jgi:hypothetical protein
MPIPIQNSSESPAILPLTTQSEKILTTRRNSGTIVPQTLQQEQINDHQMSDPPIEHYRRSFQAQNQDYFQALNNGVVARSLDSNLAEVMDRMHMNANLNPFAITSSSPPLQGKDPIASITGQQHNNHSNNKQTLQATSFNSNNNNSLPDHLQQHQQHQHTSSRGASPSSSFPHQYHSLQPTSINSSPGTNTHLALMERKNSFGRRSFNSGGRGGAAISVSDYDKLRAKITLPISPFLSPAASSTTANIINNNNNIPLKSIPAEYLYNGNNNTSGDPTNMLLNLAMVHNNNINEKKKNDDPNYNNNNNLLLLLPSSDKSDNNISNSKNDPLTATTIPTDRIGNSQDSGESSEHSSKDNTNNNKLDVVLFLERESNRRMSDLYSDIMDRSRSTSGVTRDSEIEKLSELYADEEMAFPMPPPTSTSDLTNFSVTQMMNQQQRQSGSNTQSPRQPSEQDKQQPQQQRRPSSAARQLLSASPSGQISESNTYYSLVVRK